MAKAAFCLKGGPAAAVGDGPALIARVLTEAGGCAVTEASGAEIAAGALDQADVAVFAGGSGSRQFRSLGVAGAAKLKAFLENGGGYVGICAGAFLATANSAGALGLINARTMSPKWRRGAGTLKIELTEAGWRLFGETAGEFDIRYRNGPVVGPARQPGLPEYEVLAVFRTELAENGTPVGLQTGSPALLAAPYGRGRVLISSPHPEQTPALRHWIPAAVRYVAPRPVAGEK